MSTEDIQLGGLGGAPADVAAPSAEAGGEEEGEEEEENLTPEELARAIQEDAYQRRQDQQMWWQKRERERLQQLEEERAMEQPPVTGHSGRCAPPNTSSTADVGPRLVDHRDSGAVDDDWPSELWELGIASVCLDVVVRRPNHRECPRCCACGPYRCAYPRCIYYGCMDGGRDELIVVSEQPGPMLAESLQPGAASDGNSGPDQAPQPQAMAPT